MSSGRKRATVRAVVLAACSIVVSCQDPESPSAAARPLWSAGASLDDVEDGVSIASNNWVTLPSLANPRFGHAAVSLSGCVWAIGGTTGRYGTIPLSSVERYCPAIDATRWSAAAALPEPLSDFAGVGIIASKIYVAGGLDSLGQGRRTLYIYSAAMGWTLSPDSLPQALACGGGGAVVGGKLYVFGGDPIAGTVDCLTATMTLTGFVWSCGNCRAATQLLRAISTVAETSCG